MYGRDHANKALHRSQIAYGCGYGCDKATKKKLSSQSICGALLWQTEGKMDLLVEDTRCSVVSPKEIPSLQTAITSTSDQTVSWVVDGSYFHLIRISKQHQLFTWTPLTNHISCLHTLNVTVGRSLLPQHSPFGKCQSYLSLSLNMLHIYHVRQ